MFIAVILCYHCREEDSLSRRVSSVEDTPAGLCKAQTLFIVELSFCRASSGCCHWAAPL